MDWIQTLITFLGIVVGSGLIQFFFNRKDKQKEDAKKDNAETIKKEMKDHLTNVNNQWKIDYCDKNAKAIADLTTEVREGLKAREETGKRRYDEHALSIKELSIQHQNEFLELKKAIDQLTKNDTNITSNIEKMSNKQDVIADGMVGIAHDRIVFLTDKIIERGAVTMKEKATLESIYVPYQKMGGNSYAKKGMEHVDKLSVVTEEEAEKMDKKLKERGIS